jgi:hypothetical protein
MADSDDDRGSITSEVLNPGGAMEDDAKTKESSEMEKDKSMEECAKKAAEEEVQETKNR